MASIQVKLLAETRGINRGIQEANSKLATFGNTANKVGGLLKGMVAGFVVGEAVNGIKSMVSAASDLQQSTGATQAVFGKTSKKIIADSNNMAKAVGLSSNQYLESMNLIGSLGANQGLGAAKAAKESQKLIKVGADLSAVFGGSVKDATEALSSAYKGEFDPMQRYGVTLTQNMINQKAMADANVTSTSAFNKLSTAQQTYFKHLATTQLVEQQTLKTRGQFGKQTNTLAEQQQILGAQFENLKAKLGTALLPVITKVVTFINDGLFPAFGKIGQVLAPVQNAISSFFNSGSSGPSKFQPVIDFINGQFIPAFHGIVGAVQNLGTTLAPIVAQVVSVFTSKWSQIQPLIQQVWTNVQSIITSAMSIIQSVITAYTNTIGAIWQRFGGTILSFINGTLNNMIKVIGGAFNIVAGIFKTVAALMRGDWSGAWDGIKQITKGALSVIGGIVGELGTIIHASIRVAWGLGKAAFQAGVSGVVGIAKGLGGKITGAVGDLSGLLVNAGKSVIQGLIHGIDSMIGAVTSKLHAITDLIPKHKGPESKDKVLLFNAGKSIMQGLVNGFDAGTPDVEKTLSALTKKIGERLDGKATAKIAKGASKAQIKAAKAAAAAQAKQEKAQAKAANAVVKQFTPALTALGNKYNDLATQIKAAQDAVASYASGVASNIKGMFNIFDGISTQPFGDGGLLGAILGNSAKQAAQIQDFTNVLDRLRNSGLNETVLNQLIAQGPALGTAYGNAIAEGGSAAISQLNANNQAVTNAANALGASMANSFAIAGQNTAAGFISGLQSQEAAVLDEVENLGKKVTKAFKKALGIKSPSRVFKQNGIYVQQGLVAGLTDASGLRQVNRASTALANSVNGSFTANAATPTVVAPTSGGSNGPGVVVNVYADATTDPRMQGRKIVDVINAHLGETGKRLATA